MLFNSFEYFFFLPLVFLIYWMLKRTSMQNLFLVVASYIFYTCWDWRFLSLIIITTISSWGTGCLMECIDTNKRMRSIVFYVNITLNLAILGVFKYYNFFAKSFSELLGSIGIATDYPTLNVILPVGISFYTFRLFYRCLPLPSDTMSFTCGFCSLHLLLSPISSWSYRIRLTPVATV